MQHAIQPLGFARFSMAQQGPTFAGDTAGCVVAPGVAQFEKRANQHSVERFDKVCRKGGSRMRLTGAAEPLLGQSRWVIRHVVCAPLTKRSNCKAWELSASERRRSLLGSNLLARSDTSDQREAADAQRSATAVFQSDTTTRRGSSAWRASRACNRPCQNARNCWPSGLSKSAAKAHSSRSSVRSGAGTVQPSKRTCTAAPVSRRRNPT